MHIALSLSLSLSLWLFKFIRLKFGPFLSLQLPCCITYRVIIHNIMPERDLTVIRQYIAGLAQGWCNSTANALEVPQHCAKPPLCTSIMEYGYSGMITSLQCNPCTAIKPAHWLFKVSLEALWSFLSSQKEWKLPKPPVAIDLVCRPFSLKIDASGDPGEAQHIFFFFNFQY